MVALDALSILFTFAGGVVRLPAYVLHGNHEAPSSFVLGNIGNGSETWRSLLLV